MADIVVGIASSHTPQLSSGVDMWPDHAERDRRNPRLLGRDAVFRTYDELLPLAPPGLDAELDAAAWKAKYARCQDAISVLAAHLRAAAPDVAIVIGDDQREMFLDDGIPAFACFAGESLSDFRPPDEVFGRIPAGIRAAYWAVHGEKPARHRVAADLAMRIAEELTLRDFDLSLLTEQPAGRTLGHAFTFPRYRLGLPPETPIVPLFVNTYYQPNVPSADRCYAFGQAIRQAVSSWSPPAPASPTASAGTGTGTAGTGRVAVIASGGLSHFVVDEELDQRVLGGIASGDAAVLRTLPRDRLRSGNSEILNWVTAAGALECLTAAVVDYVPGYRTPAGTGTGMAFAHWRLN